MNLLLLQSLKKGNLDANQDDLKRTMTLGSNMQLILLQAQGAKQAMQNIKQKQHFSSCNGINKKEIKYYKPYEDLFSKLAAVNRNIKDQSGVMFAAKRNFK